MNVKAIKTDIIKPGENINDILKKSITNIPEKSIVVIAAKAVSFCENRLIPIDENNPHQKEEIIKEEAEFYTDSFVSRYNLIFTIKRNILWVNAGVDESNGDDHYVLWPKDPQKSVNDIWHFLRSHFKLKEIGVTLSDSSSYPLNLGVVGRAFAYCGFNPLRNYIGTKDLFGREMEMERTNVMQSATDAATLEMGEGNEQKPIAIVNAFSNNIEFQDHPPTKTELDKLEIGIEDDAYEPMLKKVEWKKGKS